MMSGSEPGGAGGRPQQGAGREEFERLVSADADGIEEQRIEAALRPKKLDDFVGQERVREQLSLVLHSALRRGRTPDHVLLSGGPGLGKTTLAMIIAAELGQPLRISSGPAIERAGDLAAVLSTLAEGEVLFLDEIHGATTRAGMLPGPLRDRFGFVAHMDFYEPAELEVIVRRSAKLLDVEIADDAAAEVAGRSRGTPRIANRLLRRVRDYAEVRADGVITKESARAALALYEVDERGLDRLDRSVLESLMRKFGGGPVGLSTLAVSVGEEPETVEVVAEPFLVRQGLLARTPRGRVATAAAWAHLGLAQPPTAPLAGTLFEVDEDAGRPE